jgi:hypothetical protein
VIRTFRHHSTGYWLPQPTSILRSELRATIISCTDEFKAIAAQEAQLRGLLKTGALSADVATAALEAVDAKRRKLSRPVKRDSAGAVREFLLKIECYRSAIQNLGKLMSDSDRITEARALVRDLLGGQVEVLRQGERVGARFPVAGLLALAAERNSRNFSCLEFGSGGAT